MLMRLSLSGFRADARSHHIADFIGDSRFGRMGVVIGKFIPPTDIHEESDFCLGLVLIPLAVPICPFIDGSTEKWFSGWTALVPTLHQTQTDWLVWLSCGFCLPHDFS